MRKRSPPTFTQWDYLIQYELINDLLSDWYSSERQWVIVLSINKENVLHHPKCRCDIKDSINRTFLQQGVIYRMSCGFNRVCVHKA